MDLEAVGRKTSYDAACVSAMNNELLEGRESKDFLQLQHVQYPLAVFGCSYRTVSFV